MKKNNLFHTIGLGCLITCFSLALGNSSFAMDLNFNDEYIRSYSGQLSEKVVSQKDNLSLERICPLMLQASSSYAVYVNMDYVSSVKNQEETGSCWAFSSLSVLESYQLKHLGQSPDYSESHLIYSCSYQGNNPFGFNFGSGGNYDMVLAYLTRSKDHLGGPALESDDSFQAALNTSKTDVVTRSYSKTAGIPITNDLLTRSVTLPDLTTYSSANVTLRTNKIKQLIIDNGAVAIGIHGNTKSLFYNSSEGMNYYLPYNYYLADSSAYGADHGVTIVGWNDNYAASNFQSFSGTPGRNGAFLVKNSWGSEWGQNGYFWMSYESYFVLATSISQVEARSQYAKEYEYDTFGKCFSTGFTDGSNYNPSAVYGNHFTKDASSIEVLEALSTYAVVSDTYYRFFVCQSTNFENAKELTITNLGQKTSLGYLVSDPGYYTAKLSSPIYLSGNDFYVYVLAYKSGGGPIIPFEAKITGYSDNMVASYGESFAATNLSSLYSGELSNFYKKLNFQTGYANVCLKAFTNYVYQSTGKVKNIKETKVTTNSYKITWKKVKNATGYRIYRLKNKNYTLIKTVSKNYYQVKGKKAGQKNTYKILPVFTLPDGSKAYGQWSGKVKLSTKPKKISKLKCVSSSGKKATISYQKVKAATGYKIYYSKKKNSGYSCLKTITKNTKNKVSIRFKKTGTYYVYVRTYIKTNDQKLIGKKSNIIKIKAS